MVNRCSKFLHFGRKSWGKFEKPTLEVPILGTVCHLDLICGVFQQTLCINIFAGFAQIFAGSYFGEGIAVLNCFDGMRV
jgi:hypothetical protein